MHYTCRVYGEAIAEKQKMNQRDAKAGGGRGKGRGKEEQEGRIIPDKKSGREKRKKSLIRQLSYCTQ